MSLLACSRVWLMLLSIAQWFVTLREHETDNLDICKGEREPSWENLPLSFESRTPLIRRSLTFIARLLPHWGSNLPTAWFPWYFGQVHSETGLVIRVTNECDIDRKCIPVLNGNVKWKTFCGIQSWQILCFNIKLRKWYDILHVILV
jgi:hypothetical protein